MAVFEEDEIVVDYEKDEEFCPVCGENGYLMDLHEDEEIPELVFGPREEICEDGDFVIQSCGPIGNKTSVSVIGDGCKCYQEFSGENQEEEVRKYITERMRRDNFYPNVWTVSDHGNLTLTTIEGAAQ
jgi:hypothetical protein